MDKVRFSITKKIAIIFCVILASSFLFICLINLVSLSSIYTYNKRLALVWTYDRIDESLQTGDFVSEDFGKELKKIAAVNNVEILIIDSDTETVISTTNEATILTYKLLDYIFKGPDAERVIEVKPKYQIQKTKDPIMNTEFLELWGVLSDNNLIIMRTSVESMKEAAKMANLEMCLVGIIVTVVSFFIILFISRKITKPIMNLVSISEKMTHLDFSEKFYGKGVNEIDELGEHFNALSESLEKTILELKSANLELQQDIKKKDEIEEIRKEFISNVSHELKTPIALIQGYAEGLKDCVNDDEESKDYYCDVIIDEAVKMNQMVRGLLDLSSLEFGVNDLDIQHFNICELIKNCAQSFDIMIKNENIELFLPGDECNYVWADEFRTEQILTNYMSNAIHYVKDPKIIKIYTEKKDDILRVNVYNSGDNIDEEVIPKLWNKFYKVDKARTREYGGSGIGLSIVKAGMELMGHEYGVYNVPGGVVFWFELDASEKC